MNLAIVPAHHLIPLHYPPLFTHFFSMNHCSGYHSNSFIYKKKKKNQSNLGQSVKKIDGWEVFA